MDDGDWNDRHPPDESGLLLCRKRAGLFVLLIAVWSLVIVARMSQIMIFNREKYLDDITRESWHRGMIPPQRGRILDSDGNPLAWSVRIFQFKWDVPADPATAGREWEAFKAVHNDPGRLKAEHIPTYAGKTLTLIPAISPKNVRALHDLCRREPAFRIVARFIRHHAGSPKLRRLLGHTTQRNGIEIGVDGLERTHDIVLRGRPGVYRVMLDPQGKWIMETWEIIQDMHAGYDVFLPPQTTR